MNYRIRKILVPVDLSETSLNALDTAVAIAKKTKAGICLLNIVEPKFGSISEENDLFNTASLSNSKDVLNALAGSIQHAHEVKPVLIQKEGTVSEWIIKTSLAEQVDLIVMGAHGASGYRDGFIGSNTYCVMKHVVCPVLSIPIRQKFTAFKKVVFPIRPVSGALQKFDVLCPLLASQSTMSVLGLSYRRMERETNVLDKIVEEIKDKIEQYKTKTSTLWGDGNTISDDVLQYAHQNTPDLIVLTNVLDVTTKSGFIGPHTQKIVNCSKSPVLSIKGVGVPSYA